MTREEAISKIEKLLKVTEKSNATEAEVATAMTLAQTLMAKYHLEFTDLGEEKYSVIEVLLEDDTKSISSNKMEIVNNISKYYRCIPFICYPDSVKKCKLCGYHDDILVAVAAINLAYSSFKNLSSKYCSRTCSNGSRSEKTMVKNGYLQGFIRGLVSALKENKEQSEQFALVLSVPSEVNKRIDEITNGTVRSRKMCSHDVIHNLAGYADGYNTFKCEHEMLR